MVPETASSQFVHSLHAQVSMITTSRVWPGLRYSHYRLYPLSIQSRTPTDRGRLVGHESRIHPSPGIGLGDERQIELPASDN